MANYEEYGRQFASVYDALFPRSQVTAEYIAVDVSSEMLSGLKANDHDQLITPLKADFVSDRLPGPADLIICVCATLGMVIDPSAQQDAISHAADSLAPGGTLIVETHNPSVVRDMHVETRMTLAVPYEGDRRALVSFSQLEDPAWRVEHCWIDAGRATFMQECSRLTELAEIDTYATTAGLQRIGHYSGLAGRELDPRAPLVSGSYRRIA
ncbi:class I SAM-dependent methyltransferase [Leifsonia aquatica]|uniref:class I SAM-dependent methyltransferase n=1 Tax=Leifsonia aquatica TaxID=144185 RepID=UPI003812F0C2